MYLSVRHIVKASLDDLLGEQEVKLRPSNLGHCERRNALSILHNIPPDEDIEKEGNWGLMGKGAMVLGKVIEAALAPAFKKAGFLYQCLVKITGDLEGHIDFYLPQGKGDYAIVMDLKTTGKSSIPYLPNPSHILQVTLYMHGVMEGEVWETDEEGNPIRKLERPSDVRGVIYYLIREDPYYMFDGQEYWFSYNPALAEKGIKAYYKLKEKVQEGEIPPIPPGYKPFLFPCYYSNQFGEARCPFWETCWKDIIENTPDEKREIAENIIKAYNKKKKAEEELERWKEVFLEVAKDKMQEVINTPIGFVKKTTVTREDVNYQGVFDTLVNEGYLSKDVLEKVISFHTVRKSYSRVDVRVKKESDKGLDLDEGGI